jgi:hypothetical protein
MSPICTVTSDIQQTSAADEKQVPWQVMNSKVMFATKPSQTSSEPASMYKRQLSQTTSGRSDSRQLTAMMTVDSFSKANLLAIKKHVSAAKASLQVASLRKPDRCCRREMCLWKQILVLFLICSAFARPPLKKLDKQFRFRSGRQKRQKRRPVPSIIRKPEATKVGETGAGSNRGWL